MGEKPIQHIIAFFESFYNIFFKKISGIPKKEYRFCNLFIGKELCQLVAEGVNILKLTIYRCETDVSNLIDGL